MNWKVSFLSKDMTESWTRYFETKPEAEQCYNDNRAKAKYIALFDNSSQHVF